MQKNIDDYCVLLNLCYGWYTFKSTGVDLNLQFPAGWEQAKQIKYTQGNVIYWQFQNYTPENAYAIGMQFAGVSGYSLEETPYNSSFAGYKDWFIQNYNKPGYTIEAGLGDNPLPISQFDQIYSDNLGILILGAVLS